LLDKAISKGGFEMSNENEEPRVVGVHEVVVAAEDANQVTALYHDLFGLKFDLEWSMPNGNINVKAATIGETLFQVIEPLSYIFVHPESTHGVLVELIESKSQPQ
jgi:hypothetical protein